jgi:hypothetical protein
MIGFFSLCVDHSLSDHIRAHVNIRRCHDHADVEPLFTSPSYSRGIAARTQALETALLEITRTPAGYFDSPDHCCSSLESYAFEILEHTCPQSLGCHGCLLCLCLPCLLQAFLGGHNRAATCC